MHYFAYGSNTWVERLHERVGSVDVVGVARLRRYRLSFNKRGQDGSGKCNIVPASNGRVVLGALYSLTYEQWERLAEFERGYRAAKVAVSTSKGSTRAATFIAEPSFIDDSLIPFDWYHNLVVRGAESFGFPAEYIDALRGVAVIRDPDRSRRASAVRAHEAARGGDP